VGFSIPTDDDTVRQVVEPKAPPIPSRWAAVERLSGAGISVGVSVTPLMPMADPAAFARRARESGIISIWVGMLRLLQNDPFYDVLARNRWLKALDPDYATEIREAMTNALPPMERQRKKEKVTKTKHSCDRAIAPRKPTCQPTQPSLFKDHQ
jgi:DNA repair photolyase